MSKYVSLDSNGEELFAGSWQNNPDKNSRVDILRILLDFISKISSPNLKYY